MPTLSTHTHCQVAQKANRTSQNLSKSMSAQRTVVNRIGSVSKGKMARHTTGAKKT